jgi:hypothetical protein
MTDQIQDYVLREGLEDWVSFDEVQGVSPGATDEERLTVVRTMAEEGLIEVGDLREGPFRAWEGGVDEWIPRIREMVASGGDTVFQIWLSNTPAGDALARRS